MSGPHLLGFVLILTGITNDHMRQAPAETRQSVAKTMTHSLGEKWLYDQLYDRGVCLKESSLNPSIKTPQLRDKVISDRRRLPARYERRCSDMLG